MVAGAVPIEGAGCRPWAEPAFLPMDPIRAIHKGALFAAGPLVPLQVAAKDCAVRAMTATIRNDEARMTGAAGPAFVHLKVHSAYSLLEGAITIAKLAKLAVAQGFPALGLTDSGNLFGALEFSDKLAAAGVQPIVGLTLKVDFGDGERASPVRPLGPPARLASAGAIALFACDERGYQNLMQLASRAFLDPAESEPPHVKLSQLQGARSQGLIALTGGPDGPINRALGEDRSDLAGERLAALAAIYGDRLYVELQRHGLPHEIKTEPDLIALAYARGLPIVASNEVYFAGPDDYEAHDALLCIAEGSYATEDNRRRLSREHYFKSGPDMVRLFRDLPEALANSI